MSDRDEASFPPGDSEAARLMRALDAENCPLGAPRQWPSALKTAVGLLLPAGAEIVLFWGPDYVALYNDAYAPTIGRKHPQALGRPARENWAELWDDLEPLLAKVRESGETISARDRPFYIERHGHGETVHFDISYSPVPEADGSVGGVLCIVCETTERVKAARDGTEERLRLRQMVESAPGMIALTSGPDHVIEFANRAYTAFAGNRELAGRTARDALPEIAEQGFIDMLDEVYRTGKAYEGRDAEIWVEHADGARKRHFVDFVYQPILNADGAVTGIFAEGHDVTARFESARRLAMQNRLLELAMGDAPLEELLAELLLAVEAESDTDMLASILLFDAIDGRLRHGAAPNLPAAYTTAIDGIEIGPGVGSCGTAAYRREPVFVSDIAAAPLWADFRDLALEHGLRACWSVPIFSTGGELLGTFAFYYREPRAPAESDFEAIDYITRSASLVIERKQAERALEEESNRLETLNRTGAAVAAELDHENVAQIVTDAGVQLTGAQFGALFYNRVDAEGESYMLYALSGVDRSHFDKFPMPRNTAIFAPTFRGEGVVRSDDITADPRYGHNAPNRGMPEGHLPVRSYLSVPVISRGGEVLGGLFFGHSEPARFSEGHEKLMLGLAAQTAIAIDNARLYSAAQAEIAERTATEDRLREVTARLDAVLNNTRMAVFVMDEKQHCIFANAAAEELTGYRFEEMSGRPLHDVIHHTHPDGTPYALADCPIDRAFPENEQTSGEEVFVHRDGNYYPVAFTASPIRDDSSQTVGTILEVQDISEQKERAAQLAEALQVKDALLHEVNHRVKNSLQVVTSLLMLQAGQATEPALRQAILEARNRIGVVANMHQRLYSTSQHHRVDFGEYLREAAGEAVKSMSVDGRIKLEVDLQTEEVMALSRAVPLALIVNELITNSVKYAFPDGRRGHISVGLERDGEGLLLSVSDDGVGLPDGFDMAQSDGLGMKIVRALTRQVRGTTSLHSSAEGTIFTLRLSGERRNDA